MTTFRRPSPTVVESDEGRVRLLGRAGLEVAYDGRLLSVDSEMLAPPMTIAVYDRSGDLPSTPDPGAVLAFAVEALEHVGFRVDVVQRAQGVEEG